MGTDVEKQIIDGDIKSGSDEGANGEKRRPSTFAYDRETRLRQGSATVHHESFFSAFHPSSFKRNSNARVVTEAVDSEGRPLKDWPPAEPALVMKLKQRHLQMVAIGGSIGMFTLLDETGRFLSLIHLAGTGLFVGSGSALATDGPASLVIAYGLIGAMMYCTVHALGELAVLFPIAGAFTV